MDGTGRRRRGDREAAKPRRRGTRASANGIARSKIKAATLAGASAIVALCNGCHGCSSPTAAPDTGSPDATDADASIHPSSDASDAGVDSGLLHADGPLTFRLASGNDVPENRPNAWAYLPTHFDPAAPLHVIVLFHGFRNCIYSYTAHGGRPCVPSGPKRTGYDVAGQMERANSGAIAVVPEISFNEDTSDPQKLGGKGALRAFLEELIDVALAPYVGPHRSGDVTRLALGASSGGYQALLPVMEVGGVNVTELYFFDALYLEPIRGGAVGNFLWASPDEFDPTRPAPRRFTVVYTDNGGTTAQSEETARLARAWLADAGRPELGSFEDFTPSHRVPRHPEPTVEDLKPPIAIVYSSSEHDKIMHRDFWTVVAASGI
jgi:hypothetical protein